MLTLIGQMTYSICMSVYKLNKTMKRENKTANDVAAESGISLSTVYRFRHGKPVYFSTRKLLEAWIEYQNTGDRFGGFDMNQKGQSQK